MPSLDLEPAAQQGFSGMPTGRLRRPAVSSAEISELIDSGPEQLILRLRHFADVRDLTGRLPPRELIQEFPPFALPL